MGHCSVLCFGTGARHGRLTLGRPGHQVVTEVDAEARGRTARVWAASPVGVGVGCELVNGSRAQVQTGRQRPLDVSQDAFDQRKVWLVGVVHEEADLLDSISQVRPCQSEVLERTRKAPVLRGIGNWGAL